jgi:putative FmdB family regulatory protein
MPLYTYHCNNCGVQFDQQQKFTDPSLTICPECGSKKLRKVYSPVGIVFKGSGFYATDHKSPSGMKYSGKSEEKSESASEDKPKDTSSKGEAAKETKSDQPAKKEPAKTD